MKSKSTPYQKYLAWMEYQLEITSSPFTIKADGKEVYTEWPGREWRRHEFDSKGNKLYFENSTMYWAKWEYDEEGLLARYTNSNGEDQEYVKGRILKLTGNASMI